jgi:ribose 5-phosphate isomerase A
MGEKEIAAEKALEYVKPGMVLGMGTGSTFDVFLEKLKDADLDVTGVATSKHTEERAQEYGILMMDINEAQHIDLAIDGADEIDPRLNLVKGHGNALTREKIIDYRADRLIIMGDSSKLVQSLGEKKTIPVEVLPFGWRWVERQLGCPVQRKDVITDNGNYILLAELKNFNPAEMERKINAIPGVIENGIFTKCDIAIAGERVIKREK